MLSVMEEIIGYLIEIGGDGGSDIWIGFWRRVGVW